jgi:hypothetical protein
MDTIYMFNKNIDHYTILVILFIDHQLFFVWTVVSGNFGNLCSVMVLQFVDVASNLALSFFSTDSCQQA